MKIMNFSILFLIWGLLKFGRKNQSASGGMVGGGGNIHSPFNFFLLFSMQNIQEVLGDFQILITSEEFTTKILAIFD